MAELEITDLRLKFNQFWTIFWRNITLKLLLIIFISLSCFIFFHNSRYSIEIYKCRNVARFASLSHSSKFTSFFVGSMKTEYEVREDPTLHTWMQGGLDYIMLQYLNTDGIRTIGSVLGQSIALDYYVRQVGFLSTSIFQRYLR